MLGYVWTWISLRDSQLRLILLALTSLGSNPWTTKMYASNVEPAMRLIIFSKTIQMQGNNLQSPLSQSLNGGLAQPLTITLPIPRMDL